MSDEQGYPKGRPFEFTYPHWCRDEHDLIGFSSLDEQCPVCKVHGELYWEQERSKALAEALREMVDRFESADDDPPYVTRARAALEQSK